MNNLTNKQKDFLTKLKALMQEYDVTIGCNIDGDTHAIIDKMVIEENTRNSKPFFSPSGSWLDASDIKI